MVGQLCLTEVQSHLNVVAEQQLHRLFSAADTDFQISVFIFVLLRCVDQADIGCHDTPCLQAVDGDRHFCRGHVRVSAADAGGQINTEFIFPCGQDLSQVDGADIQLLQVVQHHFLRRHLDRLGCHLVGGVGIRGSAAGDQRHRQGKVFFALYVERHRDGNGLQFQPVRLDLVPLLIAGDDIQPAGPGAAQIVL